MGMNMLNNTVLITGSTIIALFMATTMIFIRSKAAKQPTSIKKIILPPIFMSSGALMYLFPVFRLTFLEVIEVTIVGLIFSIVLIKFTKFEVSGNDIYLIPSKAFIFILIGLLAIRLVIKTIIGSFVSFGTTSGMFYLLALVMIVAWRLAMVRKYIQLKRSIVSIKTR